MIFMGPLYRREQEREIQEHIRHGGSNAGTIFQWSIIDGLQANLGHGIRVINALPVGTFPKAYSRLILPDESWKLGGVACQEIGCINLPFLKQWGRFRRAKKLIRGLRNEEVMLCTTYLPFLLALHKLHPSNRLTVIATDLPEYADMHQVSRLRKLLRQIHTRMVYHYLRRADRFVLLTEQMAGPLQVGHRPYLVMEGICGLSTQQEIPVQRSRAILYSGRLNTRYGIADLLEAFAQLQDNTAELWLCGNGEMEPTIRTAAQQDTRIRFFGFLPQDQVRQLQCSAAVLVNPRPNNEEYTKYSFPSKTMEYLASGTPVVMHRLDGIPAEYDVFLHYIPGNTPQELKVALETVLNTEPQTLRQQGDAAQRFIFEKKSALAQTKRILQWLEGEA